jgi:serine carboxypeptidase-like clade 1
MSQSIDAFAALEVWYAGFSEFMANPLFVSGESYAGVYVPYLSWQIYENNLKAEWNTTLKTYNLTGFLVGNGCTNWDFDTAPSDPETFANMQLIPPQMMRAYQEGNCVEYPFWNSTGDNITQCDELYSQM